MWRRGTPQEEPMSKSHRRLMGFVLAAVAIIPIAAQVPSGVTTRVSVATGGTQANGWSGYPALSGDGRFVAFESDATNFTASDTNATGDIFVHDRDRMITTRVSVTSEGTEANGWSSRVSISSDGRTVAFESYASNLVADDTNGRRDIFVHDLDTGATTRVSVATDGTEGNNNSNVPKISADGRYVAFASGASTLVPNDTNGAPDIFVHDRDTGVTTRVSVASNGAQANSWSDRPAISADGRYVAFESSASNLVEGDTNVQVDMFVHDRVTGATTRVSVATGGAQSNGSSAQAAISADGQIVAFESSASNLVPGDTNGWDDVFVHNRGTGTTTRVSVATGGIQATTWSYQPAISGDGRFVVFDSLANNLVAGDTNGAEDIFVHDLNAGTTTRVSVATGGTQGNGDSTLPAMSADGRFVAFNSNANNLVAGDTNVTSDVFAQGPEWLRAPTGLAGSVTGSNITLSWTAPAGGSLPVAYIIEAGSAPGSSNLATVNTGNAQTSFSASGVGNGEYYLRVRANYPVGTSGPSNEIRLVVGSVVPGAPGGLTGDASGSTLSLSWTAPTTGGAPTAYVIEAGSATGLANLANFSTGNTATSFVANGVANGRYYLRVRAANSAGTSGPSNEVAVVVGPAAPGAPSGLTWSSAGSTISLSWTAPATGGAPITYIVEAGSSAGLSNLANFSTGNTLTTYTTAGVGNGTYFIRVKASNTGGAGPASNEVPLLVGCTASPGAAAALHTNVNSGGTVQFGWNAPSFTGTSNGPTTYMLEAGNGPGLANLAVVDLGGPGTTATFSGIAPGTYYVRVKARNLCGIALASNEFVLIVS
jgi:Tol biopolymer transport system component